jgi:hypothetical protein
VNFMSGARRKGKTIHHQRSETALAHGAGVEIETGPWRVGRQDRWAQLSWA